MTTVLVVEDNLTLLESIAFELEMRDFDVVQAGNGQEAVAVLSSANALPDIIVSDIAMPDMDGYALLETVRGNKDWQHIPFLFLSAFDSKNAIRIGRDLGVDDYILKPFEPDDLVAAMENKLKRFQQLRESTISEIEATRRQFLRMLSHDLRTPLTSIYGSAEMMAKLLPNVSDDVTQQLVTLLRSGTKRMKLLIERLVSLVQIESGQLQAQFETAAGVNLNEVVRQAIETYILPDAVSDVQFVGLSTETKIKGIQPFLVLVVGELLDNAQRYAGTDNQITVTINQVGQSITLTVQDTGHGIPAEELSQLQQELGAQGSTYLTSNAIGLGLVIVRDVVRIHQGTLALHSVDGSSTRVSITLPVWSESE